jgi:hypothetical protein
MSPCSATCWVQELSRSARATAYAAREQPPCGGVANNAGDSVGDTLARFGQYNATVG